VSVISKPDWFSGDNRRCNKKAGAMLRMKLAEFVPETKMLNPRPAATVPPRAP
jgi:hypothetical protein